MLSEELINNYEKALEQKYNAVCFDIDETIIKNDSSQINPEILSALAKILQNHIPVIFITSRDEINTKKLMTNITERLERNFNVTKKQLTKMYIFTNNGAKRLELFKNRNEFNTLEDISSRKDFLKLKNLNEQLNILLNSSVFGTYYKITSLVDEKTNNVLSIKLTTDIKNRDITDSLSQIINDLIKKTASPNLSLTTGTQGNQQVLQISTPNKVIQNIERIIGIPQDSILRIGSYGNKSENDYYLLNCPQGFSVDKTSNENNKCFPVIDNDKIITGNKAVLKLLEKAKLLPTICLGHAMKKDYTKAYAKMEKKINKGKNTAIFYFNDIINNKFQTSDGIRGLFDKASGSVKIPMYDWFNIPADNPLKKLWSNGTNKGFYYSMCDNENILLRGPETYYYFLAQRIHDDETGKDITTRKMIYDWINNNITFLYLSLISINNAKNINETTNAKMILGLMDNIRNYLLILLNQQLVSNNMDQTAMINLEKIPKDSIIYMLYANLLKVLKIMKNISFEHKYKINSNDIENIIKNTIYVSTLFQLEFMNQPLKENYSKDFRAYREIDNFAENFITCNSIIQKNPDIYTKGLCGLCYGGLEMPILMKTIDNRFEDVSVLKFHKSVTGYSKKQSLNLKDFNIFKTGKIETYEIDKEKNYILLDDNLLTGKTMQLALSTLYDLEIEVDKLIVVRYPSVNRIDQMFMPNHGAIDYRQFFNFIEGLYFSSPYSWRDPYSLDPYEDSLGVFDLNRKKILECLAKNGNYSKKSEVGNVKRRVKNENS